MNADQIGGIIRAFLPVAVVVGAHWGLDNATVTTIVGGLAALGTAVWSVQTNKPGTVIPTK